MLGRRVDERPSWKNPAIDEASEETWNESMLLVVEAFVLGQAVDHLLVTLEKKDCSCLMAAMEVVHGGGDGRQQ